MKLIVGLGNPGRRYEGTRHNIGFAAVGRMVAAAGGGRSASKFDAEYHDLTWKNQRVLLVRPLTFMNLSGQSVRKFADFFRLPLPDILVICDDLALPAGKIRLRAGGTSGGQKGLQNIFDQMGSTAIPRLRIGIGSSPEGWDAADYVLSKIPPAERLELDASLDRAVEASACWLEDGIASAMNRFN